MRYVVAVYELDRCYGGPEEGGWWYNTGDLIRILAVYKDEQQAWAHAERFNRTLVYRRKQDPHFRSLSSVAYSGGHLAARVCERTAPEHYPTHRPHYE